MTGKRPEGVRRRAWSSLLVGLAALSWEARAAAYQGYPKVVDTALGVPQIVETKIAPSMGCQLCHTSNTGGTLNLTAFPSYLISQFGFEKTSSEEDPLLVDALAKLEATEPKLWADMKEGMDPNVDPSLTAVAPPQPQYGCSVRSSPSDGGDARAAAGVLALLTATRRRRRRRGPDRSPLLY
jgi:MYXO-CTERM domain-containing protein